MASGTPRYSSLGAKDSSSVKDLPKVQELGTVVLKSFIFASKGPDKALVNGTNVASVFGDDTFDILKPFYQHPTRFLTRFLGYGSSAEVERLVPSDSANPANAAIYLDILADDVPNYARDSFGNYVYDNNGDAKVDLTEPTIPGYRIKFVKEFTNGAEIRELGSLDPKNGTMTKEVNGETINSTMYPWIQVNAKFKGKDYENIGFGINTFSTDEVDEELIKNIQAMTYGFKMYKRASSSSSSVIVPTLENENVLTCTLKDKIKNPNTEAIISLTDIFNEKYFNETSEDLEIRYEDVEDIFLYQEYINFCLSKITTEERKYISKSLQTWDDGETASTMEWFDYSNETLTGDEQLINLFTCESTNGKPYFSVIKDDTVPAVLPVNCSIINISNNTPIWLAGGSDGTINLNTLHTMTSEKLKEYSEPGSLRQNNIIHPENYFVDSGYPITVKKDAFYFVTLRKDTCLLLSTEINTDLVKRKFSEGNSIAMLRALNARALLAPESIYFNTECSRVAVVVGSGRHTGIIEYIPSTYNIMSYVSEMMGGLTWKQEKMFDTTCYERFAVETFPKAVPDTVKPLYWKLGGIIPEPTNRGIPKFGGLCTLYPNSTSVLNNIFTMHAVCVCERLAKYSWLDMFGDVTSTNDVFIQKVTDNLLAKHTNMFAGVYNTVPVVSLTNRDKLNGNSYTVTTKIYGNVAKTECVHNTEVFRNDTI